MKSAALEFGSCGITVNAVIPGLIDTALTRHEDRYAQAISSDAQEPAGDLSRDEEAAKKILTAKSPLGIPWINPADVAPVVAFPASDEAHMVSGASFAVTAETAPISRLNRSTASCPVTDDFRPADSGASPAHRR